VNLEVFRGLSELDLLNVNSLSSCMNRSLHLFLLPLPVCRKRLGAAPLTRRLVLPIPEILFVWIQCHLLVFNLG
jgi:hypothetical protein